MKRIHSSLLAWYKKNKRNLPWRKNQDPYRIWLSEIMLQQTRVEAVLPYYERFLSNFPTVSDLASATEDKVTNLWAGLGYYSRARNLHKAAKMIVSDFDGSFPSSIEDLRTLPGVGEYTAAAIASICYERNVPAIDGNLERVIARLIGLKKNPKTEGKAAIKDFAGELMHFGSAGSANQALMDLSASICLPKNPDCSQCPLSKYCVANLKKITHQIPVRPAKKMKIQLNAHGIIYFNKESILLARRPKGEWLADMWDIPWWIGEDKRTLPGDSFGHHEGARTITNHKIQFHVDFLAGKNLSSSALMKKLNDVASELKWVKIADLHAINLPRPTEKALNEALRAFAPA